METIPTKTNKEAYNAALTIIFKAIDELMTGTAENENAA